jgi:hypothetical protein
MNFRVVRVRRRGGTPAKSVIDLTKKAAPLAAKPKAPPPEPKRLHITAAPDGPPISEHLLERYRKIENKVGEVLTDERRKFSAASSRRRVLDIPGPSDCGWCWRPRKMSTPSHGR